MHALTKEVCLPIFSQFVKIIDRQIRGKIFEVHSFRNVIFRIRLHVERGRWAVKRQPNVNYLDFNF